MKFFKSLFASANIFTLNSVSAQTFTDEWPQIKDFYEILANTFQESEKGNFNTIKSSSLILLAKAEGLSIEGMPADYRNPKTLETLLALKKQTKHVDDLINQNVPNSEIKQAIKTLYDIFHSIVAICLTEK